MKYLRLVRFLKPADARLLTIVNETAAKMGGVKVRRTWELGGTMATAFAFPTTRELAFSKRTLEICNNEEVTAICAHELAHLKESGFILAGRLLGSLAVYPLIFINPAVCALGLPGLLAPYLLMLAILRYAKWLSQKMEKQADAQALNEQLNEGVYARALEKLHRENLSPAVNVNSRQTHPHLYDRMVSAGITPGFPRPQRPARFTPIGWALVFCAATFILLSLATE